MQIKSPLNLLFAGLAICLFAATGCDDSGTTKAGSGSTSTHEDDHGHSHDGDDAHDHEEHDHPDHGPYGGHIFPIDSDEYQGEWKKYKDNDVIRMYILNSDKKPKAVALNVDSFVVIPQAGSGDEKFELEAEKPDENGAASVFMLEDKALSMAIPLGVDIEIKVGDKVIKGQIKAHKPLDH
ncbi:MAG: hypothetical protein AB8B55_11805 [Mariniblastus sp.]